MRPRKIDFLYTNIGRGHPHYLDGIAEALVRSKEIGLVRGQSDVFEISHDISRMGWRFVRWLYCIGSQPGPFESFYERLRHRADYNRQGLVLKLLGRDIRRRYSSTEDPLVVAHPTLVGLLAGRANLIYQHGELVVPREAIVKGASTVLVPTPECAQSFLQAGYANEQVFVSGLGVESALVQQADNCFSERISRYQKRSSLVGLFVSSGAEPRNHVDLICRAIRSVIEEGGCVLILAQAGGRLITTGRRALSQSGVNPTFAEPADNIPLEMPRALIAAYNNRRQETVLTSRLFPWVDYLVAPAHERTNWSAGLGLPMFVLTPDKGSFAPLNHRLLLGQGTARTIADSHQAGQLGQDLKRLAESGELAEMAQAGWGRYPIDGFARIAAYLVQKYAPRG
ncbi:MAG: hypothetical protein ABIE70_08815 [bacterium]